jgi:hypothetical protein
MDSMTAFTSSSSRLLIDVHRDMVSAAYPCISSTVLNDNFLSILSTQLTKCDTPQDKQLCLMALNILSWILSFVSCSDNEEEANFQKKFILESSHLKLSFERAIFLISSQYENVEVVNLCLFVLMEQSTPHLVAGRSAALIDILVRCMDHSYIPKNITEIIPKNIPIKNEHWKQPIIACSALCVLLDQIPDEILGRYRSWSVDVFLLLVQSFSSNTAETQDSNSRSSSSSNSSSSSSSNSSNVSCAISNSSANISTSTAKKQTDSHTVPVPASASAPDPNSNSNSNSSDSALALDGFSADPDSRLLPLSVSTLRILGRLTPGQCTPLVAVALCSYTPAMAHIW